MVSRISPDDNQIAPGAAGPDGEIALHNVMMLGRMLRQAGLAVGPGRVIDLIRGLAEIDMTRRDDVRVAVRSQVCSRREDFDRFDKVFDLFWNTLVTLGMRFDLPADPSALNGDAASVPADAPNARDGRSDSKREGGTDQSSPSLNMGDSTAQDEAEIDLVMMWSDAEVLREKDFEQFTAEELEEAKRLMQEMRWEATRYESRRRHPAPKGDMLDPRKVIRRNMRYGGEIVDLAFKDPTLKRRPLVLICDISGSMDRYSRLLLQFLYTVHRGAEKVEAFVFGTRLTRITRQLRSRNIDQAIEHVSQVVEDWSGGTRIGDSLGIFNRRWARRVLGQGAIVVIISDGWDRGDPHLLGHEMEHLQRLTHRLIWMNPLLGMAGYQPITQGLQAALPYIDDFIPAHNLNSLEELGHLLDRVQKRRPVRHQRHEVA